MCVRACVRACVSLNAVTLKTRAWLNGVHRTCAKTAEVSRDTNQRALSEHHFGGYQKYGHSQKDTVTHSESHPT